MEWTDDDELVGGDGRPRPSRVDFRVGRRSTDGDGVTRPPGGRIPTAEPLSPFNDTDTSTVRLG